NPVERLQQIFHSLPLPHPTHEEDPEGALGRSRHELELVQIGPQRQELNFLRIDSHRLQRANSKLAGGDAAVGRARLLFQPFTIPVRKMEIRDGSSPLGVAFGFPGENRNRRRHVGRGELSDGSDTPFSRRPQAFQTTSLKSPVDIAIAGPVAGDPAIETGVAAVDTFGSELPQAERAPGDELGKLETPATDYFSRCQSLLKAPPEASVEARDTGQP